jgi:hypothetical protein
MKSKSVLTMKEDAVKKHLEKWLKQAGWTVRVAWGHKPGIDLDAKKNGKRWIIEAKGSGSRYQMRRNYFSSIIGDTLQRMDQAGARYFIAFPDLDQYRRLWKKFPNLAKRRTKITMLLVGAKGAVVELK